MGKAQHIFKAITSIPWAITEDYLRLMIEVALRQNLDPAAVEQQTGRKLDNTRAVTERGGVAIIPVVGPIARYLNLFSEISGGTSIQVLARDFTAALNNPEVRAILLNIDSPGGEANGVHEFANMVYAARGRKPIVAYVGGMGCSAAYWIASAADEIVTDATALVGSIGVIAAMPVPEGDEIVFVSSQSPRKHPDVMTEDGKADIQTTIDALAQVFVESVARNRGVSAEAVLSDFGQGSIFVGAAGVTAGLADRLGSFEETLAGLAGRVRASETQARLDTASAASARAETHLHQALTTTDEGAHFHVNLTQGKPLSDADIAHVTAEARRLTGQTQRTFTPTLSAPSATASAARVHTPTHTQEQRRMSDTLTETTRAAPPDAPAVDMPPDSPAMTEDERRQFYASERQRYLSELEAIRAEARLEVQREVARERRSMQLTAWAQDTTAATLERPYAIPIEAKDLSTFAIALDALNPKLTEQFQGFMSRILDAGLIDFREIGSQGGSESDADVIARYDAAVKDKMADGRMKRSDALIAVQREQPELLAAYRQAKGGR